MKMIYSRPIILTGLLWLGTQTFVRADTTNAPAKLTLEERRARIEAWRQEHSRLTNSPLAAEPAEDTKNLTLEERRARIRARLAEIREARKLSNQPPVAVTTNLPPAN